ncbi:unnamed protein product [Periconia digitata]|uniref:Uncharacterized protein n=1 Tax=Periconia digitata TaxID=1303443 RepID=A0A9W4U1K4_9PLEO|nr:unnamed protein product [Periconia digitata]
MLRRGYILRTPKPTINTSHTQTPSHLLADPNFFDSLRIQALFEGLPLTQIWAPNNPQERLVNL